MNDHVNIQCQKCKKTFNVARLKLSLHWGKKICVPCKYCNHNNFMEVNAALMAGKPPIEHKDQPETDYTIHLNPNDKTFQIATLHVIGNEYNKAQSFVLEEAEYLIGRQSDDDAGTPNKIRIVTEDTKMSRSHCQITVVRKPDQSYRYILTDLGSLNGTHIQTAMGTKKLEKNEKIAVQLGDIVGLGYRSQIKLEVV